VRALTVRAEAEKTAIRERRRRDARIAKHLKRRGGNVARVARELGHSYEVVRRVRDRLGMPPFPKSGPAIRGPRTLERQAVREALERTGGNVKRTARETGVPEQTVRRWKRGAVAD
jgi:transposase-like protein